MNDVEKLISALVEIYDEGADYIAACREAGYTDDQIGADYLEYIREQPTQDEFIAALKRQTKVVSGTK